MNGETSELEVTARLDRDEVELYRLVLVCSVLTDKTFTKFETSLEVSVFDEDDNAPFLNGTDSVEVAIEYNRDKVESKPLLALSQTGNGWIGSKWLLVGSSMVLPRMPHCVLFVSSRVLCSPPSLSLTET